MYESFFELSERPFDLTPNPRFLLLTKQHGEALSNLQYGMTARKGLTLLVGEAGTGKTTVIRTALQQWDAAGHLIAYLNNPTLTRDEFFESLAQSFNLAGHYEGSKARFLMALTELVVRRHDEGLLTGLLIDEAQSLSNELLEEVRLLANIETSTEKLFPVVLAGQPELATRLNEPALKQIKQRVALRCVLEPLEVREAAAYISGRIQVAGGVSRTLFTREAVMAIHEYSAGIPRLINVICDNVLLSAFAAGRRPATRDIVEEVCRDFDLQRQAAAPLPGTVEIPVAPASVSAFQSAGSQSPADLPRAAPPAPSQPGVNKGEPGGAATEAKETLFGHFTAKRRFSFF